MNFSIKLICATIIIAYSLSALSSVSHKSDSFEFLFEDENFSLVVLPSYFGEVDEEVMIFDEGDIDFSLDDLSDDEIFAPGGLVDMFSEQEPTASNGGSKPKRRGPKAMKRTCVAKDGGASWYGPGFHGKKTANGERFNQNELTAAHKTIPFNSLVRVTYRGRSVTVRINDAGPYHGNRVIDLSKAAAKAVGLMASGSGKVSLSILRCGKKG